MSVKKNSANNTVNNGFRNRLAIFCRTVKRKNLFGIRRPLDIRKGELKRPTIYRTNEKDVNWHALHYDMMEIVCKHVDWEGLTNMAKTCKGWHFAAVSEKNKRFYIQRLRIPWKIYMSLPSMLHAEPSASLLVYDSRLDVLQTVDCKLVKTFKELLRHNMIILGVDEYVTTEDPEFRHTAELFEVEDNITDILGLFLFSPSRTKQQIRIDIAWISCDMLIMDKSHNRDSALAERLAKGLGLDDREYPKSTILLIANIFLPKNRIICELGRRIQESGQEISLAVLRGVKIEGSNEEESSHGSYAKSYVALRISGENIETWTTFIRYSARITELDRHLRTLRKKIKSKRHTIGMVSVANCVKKGCTHQLHPAHDRHKIMIKLKQIFPDVRFTAFFTNSTSISRSPPFVENNAFAPDFLLRIFTYVSVFIITFDY